MKKIATLLIITLLLTQGTKCFSQTYGIKGGMNFANMTYSGEGSSTSNKSIIGIHLGGIADFMIKENIHFNTGLLYSLKGTKSDGTASDKLLLNYLEVPLNLAYKFPINESAKFFVQGGPYLGYAVSGKYKDSESSESIKFKDDFKRFDLGLGFGAGVEFGSIVASLNYEFSLTSIAADTEYSDDYTVKNKVFQISLAYMLGGN